MNVRPGVNATTEQIAADLYVSVNTVRNHVNNIIRKLNVHSRLEAVSYAIRNGLIRVG
jgi:two-component system, NarL family, nitrate/nitrite response regulator NarL